MASTKSTQTNPDNIGKTTKKIWCSNGLIDSDKHFYISPHLWNLENIIKHFGSGKWPVLIAPSQSGKTTRVHDLIARLEAGPILIAPSQSSKTTRAQDLIEQLKDSITCLPLFLDLSELVANFRQLWPQNNQLTFSGYFLEQLQASPSLKPTQFKASTLQEFFSKSNAEAFSNREVVLFLDEIDALVPLADHNDGVLAHFLSLLRALKQNYIKRNNMLCSCIGITNFLAEPLYDTIGNSPFNIQDSLLSPFFSYDEHLELFGQYEAQEKIEIDVRIKERIFDETQGAPGLEQIFGDTFETLRRNLGRVPNFDDWGQHTSDVKLFLKLESRPNLQKLVFFLDNEESDIARECREALSSRSFPLVQGNSQDRKVSNELQRKNILKPIPGGGLDFSCNFIRRFVLDKLAQRPPLEDGFQLPTVDGQLDLFRLLLLTLKRMNRLQILSSRKKKANYCHGDTPGPIEDAYRREFERTLEDLGRNSVGFCIIREQEVPTEGLSPEALRMRDELLERKKRKQEKRNQIKTERKRSSVFCDHFIKTFFGDYAIEHVADANLSRTDSAKEATTSLWHHIYAQGELYHAGLKPKETWLLNWTTVSSNVVKYWFPPEDVHTKVVYIFHDPSFQNIQVYTTPDRHYDVTVPTPSFAMSSSKKRKLEEETTEAQKSQLPPSFYWARLRRTGQPFMVQPQVPVVDSLKEAVKQKNSNALKEVDAIQLLVFPHDCEEFSEKNSLEPDAALETNTGKTAYIVEVNDEKMIQ